MERWPKLIAGLVVLAAVTSAHAAHVRARLVGGDSVLLPGRMATIAVVFTIDPGWHLYWTNPGDTGTPPKVKWTVPPGITVGPPQFPVPERLNLDGLTAFGYETELAVLFDVKADRSVKWMKADVVGHASWVVCKDACVLEKQDLAIKIRVVERGAVEFPDAAAPWRAAQPARPADAKPLVAVIDADGQHGSIDFPLAAGVDGVDFFPPAASFAAFESPRVIDAGGKRVYRAGFRVLPDPPAAYDGTAIVVTKAADGKRSAVELPVVFKFAAKPPPG